MKVSIEKILYFVFFLVLIWRGWIQARYQLSLQWGDDLQWQTWMYRIGRGEIPYKDFFVLYGPLLPYLFAVPFKILGENLFAWNVIRYIVLPSFSYLAAIFLGRVIFKTWIFRIIFLLIASTFDAWGFFFLQPWMFRIWLGLSTLLILSSRFQKKFFLAGCWVALLFFSSSEQGIYTAATILAMGIILRKNVWQFSAGLGMVLGIGFLLLTRTGGITNYLSFLVKLSSLEVTRFGLVFPGFPFDKLQTNITAFLISKEFRYYLPLFIYGFTFLWLLKQYIFHKKILWEIVFLTIYGLISFRTALGRSDFGHWMSVSVPSVFLAVWFMEKTILNASFLVKKKNIFLLGTKLLLVELFLLAASIFFFLIRSPFERGFLAIMKPIELMTNRTAVASTYSQPLGVYINKEQAAVLSQVISYLSQNTERKFYAHSVTAGFYHLTNIPNRTYSDQDFWATEEEQKEIIKSLNKEKINYVLKLDKDLFFNGSYLDDYLNEYYNLVSQYDQIIILKRNDKFFDESFNQKTLIKEFENGWKATTKNSFEIEVADSVDIKKIRVAVKLAYFPFLTSLAKTKAALGVVNDRGDEEWFSSDINFVPSFTEQGQLSFHLDKKIRVKKLVLFFSSPGGLNPAPVNIDIRKTWLFQ